MTTAVKDEDMLHGILVSKLSAAHVDAALVALDIIPAPGMPLAGKTELLVEHFRALPDSKLAICNECKGTSDADLPACPFCGDAGSVNDPGTAPEPEGEGEEHGEAPPADDGGDDGEFPGDSEDAADDANITLDPHNLPRVEPEPAKPLVKKPTKAEKAAEKAAGKQAAKDAKAAKKANALPKQDATGAAATAIVEHRAEVVPSSGKAVTSVATLEAAISEIRALDVKSRDDAWLLAQKVSELDEGQLWKLRLDDKGKVRYRTFEEFAKEELGMGREYALTLRKTYVRFKREDFVVGPSKLRYVLQAPADQQDELLEKIKETGASKREVREEVVERRKKAGLKSSQGKPAKKAKKERPAGSITVASIIGKGTHKLWKKPGSADEKPVDAKSFDGAYTYFDLGNDTRLWLYLKKKDNGTLVVQHDIRRIED